MRWVREIRNGRCADEKFPSLKLEILGGGLRVTQVTKVLDEISRRGFPAAERGVRGQILHARRSSPHSNTNSHGDYSVYRQLNEWKEDSIVLTRLQSQRS
jgi:hypothetical protein